jgi:hypothetical protein
MSIEFRTLLPDYVEGPANVVGNLPYVGYDATLQGFLFEGDRSKLQRICDRLLNEPTGGNTSFRVVSSYVFVCGLYQPRVQSEDPIDQGRGYVSEIDFGFWILTFGGHKSHPLHWRLRWLPVWLFVDAGAAIATGREVFGYPKMQARFAHKSTDPQDPTDARVSVMTHVWERIHHDACAVERELIRLVPTETPCPNSHSSLKAHFENGGSMFRDLIASHQSFSGHGIDRSEPNPWLTLLPPMFHMPMVFLKQFRDASHDRRACYQSILEVSVECSSLQRIGFFPSSYRLEVMPYPSHPIAELLGLQSGQESSYGVWLKQDFRVPFARSLWDSGPAGL